MLGISLPPTPQVAGGEPAWLLITVGCVLLALAAGLVAWILWPRHAATVRSLPARVSQRRREAA
ncbi:MAG: hypothetical protein ACE14W_11120 [Candidatus Velamenicoccus archaeovorus]